MPGQTPRERYEAGYKIGSSSDPLRPVKPNDLVIIQQDDEPDPEKSVRAGYASDVIKDATGASTLTANITIFQEGYGDIVLRFVNGLLTSITNFSGTGTAEDPYQVKTPAQLNAVRNDLDKYYIQTADISLADYEECWESIGYDSAPFTGSYDGQGYEISDLSILNTEKSGLFGCIYAANIQNIHIEDAIVTGGRPNGGGVGKSAGILAAEDMGGSHIDGCTVSGYVRNSEVAGGLVGTKVGYETSEYNQCSVALNSFTGANVTIFGGIVGEAQRVKIEESKTIHLDDFIYMITSEANCGGIIGKSDGYCVIMNTYSTLWLVSNGNLGGVIGNSYYDGISTSYFAGILMGENNPGGIAARGDNTVADGCIWDVDLNGTISTPDPLGVDGASTLVMQDWDIYNILDWNIPPWQHSPGSYPTLQWEAPI